MYISKPESPEELYPFFVKGIPLTPRKWFSHYRNNFRRKGWNISKYHINNCNKEYIQLKFYTVMSAYYPDWRLEVFKHVNT